MSIRQNNEIIYMLLSKSIKKRDQAVVFLEKQISKNKDINWAISLLL
jgi:hypothetical protein